MSILDRDCVLGELKQRDVVLRVADYSQVVLRDAELPERLFHSGSFVDSGRQNDEGRIVQDELTVEVQLLHGSTNFRLVVNGRLDDRTSGADRNNTAALQLLQQDLRGRLREDLRFASRGSMHHRAILGNDEVE